ncbi:MAG: hypothetical protein AABM32_12790 [Chloroflexota bacterium]
MPTNTLGEVAFVVGATFLLGMLVGLVLMLGRAILRRRVTALEARLLLSGPPGGLLAAALYVAAHDFLPVAVKVVLVALFLVTSIPVFAWLLQAKITFAPIGRARS